MAIHAFTLAKTNKTPMNLLSPRYRVRQLLNERWIAEFKKWPWSRWRTVSDEGKLDSPYLFGEGDRIDEPDSWFITKDDAIKAFSWLLVSDPELIEEPEGEHPSMTIGPVHVEYPASRQHVHHEQNLTPKAYRDSNPYVAGPTSRTTSLF